MVIGDGGGDMIMVIEANYDDSGEGEIMRWNGNSDGGEIMIMMDAKLWWWWSWWHDNGDRGETYDDNGDRGEIMMEMKKETLVLILLCHFPWDFFNMIFSENCSSFWEKIILFEHIFWFYCAICLEIYF